jgi:dihydrofolate reductase
MGKFRFEISMSLDGFVAGPNMTPDQGLGEGGERLHEWVIESASWRKAHGHSGGEHNVNSEVVDEALQNVGATVMGRRMFGGEGEWSNPGWGDGRWEGWWGDEPPFHHPVFVVTHHAREPLTKGETTFTFVTDGIESALEQAKAAAGGKDVALGGGASVAQQYLRAGLLDEMQVHLVPLFLGEGVRLFDGLGENLQLEPMRAIEGPGVTHLKYRVLN